MLFWFTVVASSVGVLVLAVLLWAIVSVSGVIGVILCWLGIHDWGRQENIRGGILFGFIENRMCDRICIRCGKEKEFVYDSRR
jgi:hypothetical protein